MTVERAAEIGLPVVNVPGWYDVDDAGLARAARSRNSPANPRRSREVTGRARARHARAFRGARSSAARRIGAVTAVAHSPAVRRDASRCFN